MALVDFAFHRQLQRLFHHHAVEVVQIAAVLVSAQQFFEAGGVECIRKAPVKQQRLLFIGRYQIARRFAEALRHKQPVEGFAADEVVAPIAVYRLLRRAPVRHRLQHSGGPVHAAAQRAEHMLDRIHIVRIRIVSAGIVGYVGVGGGIVDCIGVRISQSASSFRSLAGAESAETRRRASCSRYGAVRTRRGGQAQRRSGCCPAPRWRARPC